MNNQIIINLKEDGTIKNIETTKEQELQSIIKFKEDCLNEYADRIDKAIEYIENEETYEEGYCDGKLMIYKDRLEYELLKILKGGE